MNDGCENCPLFYDMVDRMMGDLVDPKSGPLNGWHLDRTGRWHAPQGGPTYQQTVNEPEEGTDHD